MPPAPHNRKEAFSRVLIDDRLRDAGWRLDDGVSVRYEYHLPDGTFADYVLCDRNGRSLAVVEAKRTSRSPRRPARCYRHLRGRLGLGDPAVERGGTSGAGGGEARGAILSNLKSGVMTMTEKKRTPAEKRAATIKQRGEMIELFSSLKKPKSKRQLLDEAQQLMYDAWEAPSRQRAIKLARQALELSPDCADAYLLLADLASASFRERFDFLRQGVEAGRRALGKAFFRDHVGEFWGWIETRPFMRVMAALADTLWETGQSDDALAIWREMLLLNPNDNQGVRYRLMAALLELQRDAEAKELEKAYMDDGVAEWLYAVSLLIFRAEGDSVAARRKLQTALQQNPHVPSYLLGRKKLPKYLPDQYIVGREDEAVICAAQLLPSWVKTPAALDWLGVEQAKKSHKAFHSSVKGKA